MKTMKLAVPASVALALTACQNSDPDDINEPTGAADGTTATWQLVNDDVTAESASLEIGVMRVECAGGETGRVLTPNITYNDDQIIIEALVDQGRVHNDAAFASLAGVNPSPASSGNAVRHRLNRGGDRRLNSTLHMVAINRMTDHPETRAYAEKRRAEGKTNKKIRCCIKRHFARRVFRTLQASALQDDLLQAA